MVPSPALLRASLLTQTHQQVQLSYLGDFGLQRIAKTKQKVYWNFYFVCWLVAMTDRKRFVCFRNLSSNFDGSNENRIILFMNVISPHFWIWPYLAQNNKILQVTSVLFSELFVAINCISIRYSYSISFVHSWIKIGYVGACVLALRVNLQNNNNNNIRITFFFQMCQAKFSNSVLPNQPVQVVPLLPHVLLLHRAPLEPRQLHTQPKPPTR